MLSCPIFDWEVSWGLLDFVAQEGCTSEAQGSVADVTSGGAANAHAPAAAGLAAVQPCIGVLGPGCAAMPGDVRAAQAGMAQKRERMESGPVSAWRVGHSAGRGAENGLVAPPQPSR